MSLYSFSEVDTTQSSITDSFDRETEAWDIQFWSLSGRDDYYTTGCGGAIEASGRWSGCHNERWYDLVVTSRDDIEWMAKFARLLGKQPLQRLLKVEQ